MDAIYLMLFFLGVMACAALAGMAMRKRLPDHHTTDSSRDAVLRSVGLVVTLSAVVLGFLVSSAKSFFDAVENELTEIAADVAALDRVLTRYGPEAEPARRILRQTVGSAVRVVWRDQRSSPPQFEQGKGLEGSEYLYKAIEALPGVDPHQSELRSQALGFVAAMQHAGLKLSRIAQARPQTLLLAVVLSWLVIVYLGFGLLSPRTATAQAALALSAVAAAGALFLVVELFAPVSGWIEIPPSILEGAITPGGPP
jgi:hypothetical protein